jgi:hypothetical protein
MTKLPMEEDGSGEIAREVTSGLPCSASGSRGESGFLSLRTTGRLGNLVRRDPELGAGTPGEVVDSIVTVYPQTPR